MSLLDKFRQENPAYQDVPDSQLAPALYNKFYKDSMTSKEFAQRITESEPQMRPENIAEPEYDFSPMGAGVVGAAQGLSFGTADELAGLVGGGVSALRGQRFGEGYRNVMEQQQAALKAAREQQGGAMLGGEIAGALGTGIAGGARYVGARGLKAIAQAAGIGGLSGGAYGLGTGYGGAEERLKSGAIGAAMGTVGGALSPAVVPAARALGRISKTPFSLAKKAAEKLGTKSTPAVNRTLTEIAEQTTPSDLAQYSDESITALRKIENAIRQDFGDNADEVIAAWKSGDDALIEAYGTKSRQLAKGSAQYAGGQEPAERFFGERIARSVDEIKSSISRNISGDENYFTSVDDILAAGRQKAGSWYDKAYKDSVKINPKINKSNLLSSKWIEKRGWNNDAPSKLYRGVSDESGNNMASLGRGLYTTTSKKYASQYGDVIEFGSESLPDSPLFFKDLPTFNNWLYDVADDLGVKKNALGEYDDLIRMLGHDGVVLGKGNNMEIVTFDISKPPKNIFENQSILDIPEIQTALNKAYRQFPSELKDVPANSIKALDYAKRVLDDDINKAVRAGSGNLARSRTEIKNQLLQAMDEASPAYKTARQKSGDYLSVTNAMDTGRGFDKIDPEILSKQFKGLSDAEKIAFKSGVGKRLRDIAEQAAEGRNVFNKVMGSPAQKKRLQAVLSPKEYQNFEMDLKAQDRLFKLRNEILGGSPTMSKVAAAEEIAGLSTDISSGGISAIPRNAMMAGMRKMFDGLNDKTANQVASILYETRPSEKVKLISQMRGSNVLSKAEKQAALKAYFETQSILDKIARQRGATAVVAGQTAAPRQEEE